MKKSIRKSVLAAASVAGLVAAGSAQASVIANWNYAGTTSKQISFGQAATVGSGTSASLGMTNAYTYNGGEGPGAADGSNFTSVTGATSGFAESTWKIVGNNNSSGAGAGKADGWNNAAPNYTQGAQYNASTAGYSNITVSFDWYCTTQGVANMQPEYTTDGTTFTPFGTDLIAQSSDFYNASSGASSPLYTLDLSGVSGVANNANFEIRFVSVKPTLGDSDYVAGGAGPGTDGAYAAAAGDGYGGSLAAPVDYNNSSGNWSFDNVTVSGSAVPEPASAALLGLAGMALLRRRSIKA
jgi:hypothetical protein